jgi:hypothetical protein
MERNCVYCGDPVDPTSRFTWRRVVGWERKAQGASRKSGSDIALREPRDEYACNACIVSHRSGVSPGQESLI